MNAELKAKREALNWEKTRYFVDSAQMFLRNPVTMLVGGFALTTILENTQIGRKSLSDANAPSEISSASGFLGVVPYLGMLIPGGFGVGSAIGSQIGDNILRIFKSNTDGGGGDGANTLYEPIYALSHTSANFARAGLVAMAAGQSGLIPKANELIEGIKALI